VPINGNLSGSETESWSSDGDDFGSLFSWIEESSDEDLDYFAALDVATAKSLSQLEVREGSAPPVGVIAEEHRQRKVVSKHNVGEMSRGGRRRWMGMELSHLRLDRATNEICYPRHPGHVLGRGIYGIYLRAKS
jgi:hypothetical protein